MIRLFVVIFVLTLAITVQGKSLLIPMDETQTDHLKAYGVCYRALDAGNKAEWLLNYRGGSFLIDYSSEIGNFCLLMGVSSEQITQGQVAEIYRQIEVENMERVELEKAPVIAVYSPSTNEPWDDAVTLALTYAEIKYHTVYDEELLSGGLEDYDWLHLHHEDFTGQYGKFYGAFRNQLWYQAQVRSNEELAAKLGYNKVSQLKLDVAKTVYDYVRRGGFFFSMCSAPETIDIALAAEGLDIVPREIDGDPVDPGVQAKLDYSRTFAFENFVVDIGKITHIDNVVTQKC